jgi:hypothetical protein
MMQAYPESERDAGMQPPEHLPSLTPESLDASLDAWRSTGMPGGILALLPEREQANLGLLQAACAARSVQLAGAIFPEIIVGNRFHDSGALLLPFKHMPTCALITDLPAEPVQAAARIAEAFAPVISEHPATLFLIFDAMVPSIGSILDALYLRMADRVAYAGVNAGSETFQPMPCLFDGTRVAGGGVLCLLLEGSEGAVLDHGYVAPKEIITATSTRGNRVISIDWRPAFEVYREQVRALYATELTHDNFYQYAIHFPFGMLLANNDLIVRIPVALEPDGSLFCVGEVPENAMLTLLRAPQVDSAGSVEHIAARLDDAFGGVSGKDLLTFYCAGRRLHLGHEAATRELDLLRARSGAARLLGALSLGEIGSLSAWGYPMFHNATLVCRPWSAPHGT